MVLPKNDYVNHIYRATVVRIIDGDSFRVRLDLWTSSRGPFVDVGFGLALKGAGALDLEVRVYGCDAPDVPHNAEKKAATAYLATLIQPGSIVKAQTVKPTTNQGKEKYGRWLTYVWLLDGRRLDEVMVEAGMAVPYTGGPR
jgi:endonuclease YncB( thermonuclease family)